jgi:hypothetical protein
MFGAREVKDPTFLQQLYAMVGRRGEDPDYLTIHVTPYFGSDGPAGVVITVFGTPPRATLLVPANDNDRIYSCWGDPKAIEPGTREHDVVREFLKQNRIVTEGDYVGPLPKWHAKTV